MIRMNMELDHPQEKHCLHGLEFNMNTRCAKKTMVATVLKSSFLGIVHVENPFL